MRSSPRITTRMPRPATFARRSSGLTEVYEIDEGKVTRSQDFATVEQALEAARMSE
jgi:hypothetical protein